MEIIDSSNVELFAAKRYDCPGATYDQFKQDMCRFGTLKKLFSKYHNSKRMNHLLVLNNIITIGNLFGVEGTVVLLLHYISPTHWCYVKPFLEYLGYINELELTDVNPDVKIQAELSKI